MTTSARPEMLNYRIYRTLSHVVITANAKRSVVWESLRVAISLMAALWSPFLYHNVCYICRGAFRSGTDRNSRQTLAVNVAARAHYTRELLQAYNCPILLDQRAALCTQRHSLNQIYAWIMRSDPAVSTVFVLLRVDALRII
jgi:hypothetical protein